MAKKNDLIVGTIQKINRKNKGIMYASDMKIAVSDALLEQTVEVRLLKKRKSAWEGRIESIVKNPDYFVEAVCDYFGVCGGCSLQNVPYENQQQQKLRQVNDLLENKYDLTNIIPSPNQYEYRNKMEFSFGDTIKDGPMALGLHKKHTTFDIITVDGCKITNSDFSTILTTVLDYAKQKNIPFYKKKIHEGVLKFLIIRRSETTGELLINLVTSSQQSYDYATLVSTLLELNIKGKIAGILHTISDSLADAVKPDSVEILYGRDYIVEEILGLTFKISAFSFFQTNTKGAQVLYKNALSLIKNIDNKVVFDLYSGTGTIAQIMALRAKKVFGIEIIKEAVASATENAKLNNLTNCEFIAGDVLTEIDKLEIQPDVIILDPPRGGIHPKAITKIINFGAEEILYISCKPTSLARDLIIFEENGYSVKNLFCVDMFPNTYHVETVCLLSKLHVDQ
ncbi:MAG: 23S rRNA (uracil-5-)-methyltransferase RumA [Epulopiscium sp. Nuni2H_MBin003]|nr:MAG: 23S rRNA (uracil-5-)-methyltransferase RumA [Epulopiscium sp. Nuni2H_MBin003]